MWNALKPRHGNLRVWQVGLLVALFVLWHVLTKPGLIPPFMFENDRQAAFFFGEPLKVFGRIWAWFVANADIYQHLWVTLLETRARVRASAPRSGLGVRAVARAAARWPRRSPTRTSRR